MSADLLAVLMTILTSVDTLSGEIASGTIQASSSHSRRSQPWRRAHHGTSRTASASGPSATSTDSSRYRDMRSVVSNGPAMMEVGRTIESASCADAAR